MTTQEIRERLAILKLTNQQELAELVEELLDRIRALEKSHSATADVLAQHLNE